MLRNNLGDFLIYKSKLYVLWSLTKTILWEYHNIMISRYAWLFFPDMCTRDDHRVILLDMYDPWYLQLLQELWYVSAFQISHPKGSWAICSTTSTKVAVVVNPHQVHVRILGGWRIYDGNDIHRLIQQNDTAGTIMRIWHMYYGWQISKYNGQSAWISRVYNERS